MRHYFGSLISTGWHAWQLAMSSLLRCHIALLLWKKKLAKEHKAARLNKREDRETLTTRLCRCYTNVNISFHLQASENHIIKYLLAPWIFLYVLVLTQSLLVSVRHNKAGKLQRASSLSGAAYRQLTGQKSQSVLTNAHHLTASLDVCYACKIRVRDGKKVVCRRKLTQTVKSYSETQSKYKTVTPCMWAFVLDFFSICYPQWVTDKGLLLAFWQIEAIQKVN